MNRVKNFYHNLINREVKETYLLITVLFNFAGGFIGPIYMLFLLSQGLNQLQANTVNTFFMASIFFLEAPTGLVADIFGRKASTVLGKLSWSLGMIIYFFSGSFWQFVLAEFFAAMGRSLVSGAFDAWLYDHLKEKNQEKEYQAIYASSQKWARLSIIPSALIAGLIGSQLSLRIPWIIAGILSLLVFILAAKFLRPDSSYQSQESKLQESRGAQKLFYITFNSLKLVLKNKLILGLTIVYLISTFGFQAYNMFWPIVFKEKFGQEWTGLIFALMMGSLALGAQLSNRGFFLKKHPLQGLFLIILLIGLPMLAGSLFPWPFFILSLFLIHEVARGALSPIYSAYINQFIPSHLRATVNSLNSMFTNLGSTTGLLVSGWMAVNWGNLNAWIVSSVVILMILPILYFLYGSEKAKIK